MTITSTATKYGELNIADIDPDPHNRTAVADAEFVASIKKAGVIEPIVVVPHPNNTNRYQLVAGERRWRGAQKAKLTTIPAVVRRDLDDKARIELAVIENLQREDVPPGQEAQQLLRLITVGHDTKTLAKAVGRSTKWVSERLKLAELPTAARTLLDDGTLSITTAVAAHGLVDQPELLDEIFATGNTRDIDNLITGELNKSKFQTEATKLIRAATKAGHTVHDGDEADTTSLHELAISEDAHSSEPCHRLILTGNPSWGAARLKPVCVDPKSHRSNGSSKVKVTASPTASPRSEADKEHQQQKRHAKAGRLEAMQAAVSARIAKPQVDRLIQHSIVTLASHETHKHTCRVLGLDVGKDQRPADVIDAYASAGTKELRNAALAVAMVTADQNVDNAWSPTSKARAKTWLGWLKTTVGFKPSAYDRQQIAASTK